MGNAILVILFFYFLFFLLVLIGIPVIITAIILKVVNKKNPDVRFKIMVKQKIIAILAGLFIIVVYRLISRYINGNTYIIYVIIGSIKQFSVVMIACIFGPFAGFFVAYLDSILMRLSDFYRMEYYYFHYLAGFYGIIMGFLGKIIVAGNEKNILKSLFIFCSAQIACTILDRLLILQIHLFPESLFPIICQSFVLQDIIYLIVRGIIIGVALVIFVKVRSMILAAGSAVDIQ